MTYSEKKRRILGRLANVRRDTALYAVFLAFVTALVFARACSFPLLNGWDDQWYVINNTANLEWSWSNAARWFAAPYFANYIPATMLSYMFDYHFWGLNGVGYHIQNLFWHIVAVLGLFFCCRKMGIRPGVALLAGLLFAIHPQRAESVIWVAERKDVLCAAFYFWSLYLYMAAPVNKGRKRLTLVSASFSLFILALLSKPMAVSLPLVMAVYDFHRQPDAQVSQYFKRLWVFIAAAVAAAVTVWRIQPPGIGVFDPIRQAGVVIHNIEWYLDRTLLPRDLSPVYPRIRFTLQSVSELVFEYIAFAAALVWLFVKHRGFLWRRVIPITACFIFAIAPVIGLTPLGDIDYADRYSYIPAAFIIFAIAALIEQLLRGRRAERPIRDIVELLPRRSVEATKNIAAIGLMIYITLLAGTTFFHGMAWKSHRHLVRSACCGDRSNDKALWMLGNREAREGNPGRLAEISRELRAVDWFRITPAQREGNRVRADFLDTMAAVKVGDHRKAIGQFARLNLGHHYIEPLNRREMKKLMAYSHFVVGDRRKAAALQRQVVETVPATDRVDKLLNSGYLHLYQGEYDEAANDFEAMRQHAANKPAVNKLIKSCREQAELPEKENKNAP